MSGKENMKAENSYRWVVLAIITIAMFVYNFLQFQVAGLASKLIPQLSITTQQFTMLVTAPMLSCAILGLAAGFLADRYGVKFVCMIALVISLIGCFGRIKASSFGTLFLFMMIIGIGLAFLNANAIKLLSAWFHPSQMGTAMGIFLGGSGLGISAALATAAFFASVESAFTLSAVLTVVIVVLWALLVKSKPKDAPSLPAKPIMENLKNVFKSRNTWFAGLAIFIWMGSYMAYNSNLTHAMEQIKKLDAVSAGLVSSTLSLSMIIGNIIGPILSDRFKALKPFMGPLAILSGLCALVPWFVGMGPLTYIFLALAGVFMGMYVPLIMSYPVLLPEIGHAYAGAAGGLLSTCQMAGAFILPSLIISPIAGKSLVRVFVLASVGLMICGIVLFTLPDMKARSAKKE